jgi:enoyl-CoA hydratase
MGPRRPNSALSRQGAAQPPNSCHRIHIGRLRRQGIIRSAAYATTSAIAQVTTMDDILPSADSKITLERRDQILLIGINRPQIHNRVDPEAYHALAKAYYDYDHDESLRAAVLFGHGENFSRGVDVDAFTALARTGSPTALGTAEIDPLGRVKRLRKPLIAVAHGDTWNMGHELFLTADIRIAAADARFGQDENLHGRFPGGGSTVRFVREAGWANAMRYMLTGDHWGAAEAHRLGVVQEIAPDRQQALALATKIAGRVACCAPLGIQTTLTSAHLAIDQSEDTAYRELDAQYGALYRTQDFLEGRRAEAEGRPPVYLGQ